MVSELINCTICLIKIRNLGLREGKKLVQANWQKRSPAFCLGTERDAAISAGRCHATCLACHFSQTTLLSPPVRRGNSRVWLCQAVVSWDHHHMVASPVVTKILNFEAQIVSSVSF